MIDNMIEKILDKISKDAYPENIFSKEKLEDWAKRNGFEKAKPKWPEDFENCGDYYPLAV